MNSNYIRSYEFFGQLIQTMAYIESQLDRTQKNRFQDLASTTFVKLRSHAHLIHSLHPKLEGNVVPDFASIAVLTRALIETHDFLAYIALDKIPDDEADFRLLVVSYHALTRRIDLITLLDGETNSEVSEYKKQQDEIRGEMLAEKYSALLGNKINKIKKGESFAQHTSQKILNEGRGINDQRYTFYNRMLSQFVHSYGLAMEILIGLQSRDQDGLSLYKDNIDVVNAFLSKAIIGMFKIFPNIEKPNEESMRKLTLQANELSKALGCQLVTRHERSE